MVRHSVDDSLVRSLCLNSNHLISLIVPNRLEIWTFTQFWYYSRINFFSFDSKSLSHLETIYFFFDQHDQQKIQKEHLVATYQILHSFSNLNGIVEEGTNGQRSLKI